MNKKTTLSTDVYQSLKSLMIEALSELAKIEAEDSIPLRMSQTISVRDSGSASLSQELKPNLWPLVFRIDGVLKDRMSYRVFLKSVESDPLISKQMNTLVGTALMQQRMRPDDLFRIALGRHLMGSKFESSLDTGLFETICRDLQEFFVSDMITFSFQSFLENMDMQQDEIILEPGIRIRRLESRDIEQMWNENPWIQESYPYYSEILELSPSRLAVVVESQRNAPKIVGEELISVKSDDLITVKMTEDYRNIVLALRILKPGSISQGPICVKAGVFLPSSAIRDFSTTSRSIPGMRYTLNAAEEKDFKAIWKMLRKPTVTQRKALAVGIRRMNYAYDRVNNEDTVIDALIALEAMILNDMGKPKERGELRHRLAVRVAHLLGGSADDMLATYAKTKGIYDLRSKVVHGGAIGLPDNDVVIDAMDLCRRSLKELLVLYSKGEKPDWDRWLFE